jgi:hypothetical protein
MSLDRIKKLLEQGSPISIKKQFPKIKEIIYYDNEGQVDFLYKRMNTDTFTVVKSLYPSTRDDFESELSNEDILLTVIQSLDDYSVRIEGDKLLLSQRGELEENYSEMEEDKRCYNCKYYDESEHLCNNQKAFSINKEYPILRDFDNTMVIVKDIDINKITIPYNFGCIHWSER